MPLQVLTDMNVAKGRLRDWETAELVLLRGLREISWRGRTLKSWLEEAFGGSKSENLANGPWFSRGQMDRGKGHFSSTVPQILCLVT